MKKRGIMKNGELFPVKANSHPQKALSVPLNINKYYLCKFHQENIAFSINSLQFDPHIRI
jgi:poly(3-hydroxyalkanoate) synthetase